MQTSKNAPTGTSNEIASLKLNCFSFVQNEMIPPRYTSDGININPCIYIEDIPEEAKSLAIIVEDPDVPHDSFCHWVVWNIPVTHHIKEKENRGVVGINDFCNHGYNGPHPFSIVHRYFFRVYALDCDLNISMSSTKTEFKNAIRGHIVGSGVIIGKYKKQDRPQRNLAGRTAQIHSEEWTALLNEKGTCVSLILPLQTFSQEQVAGKFFLQKEIKAISEQLIKNSPEDDEIISTLKRLQDEIVIHPNETGIGIYVSNGISLYTGFPFEVQKKTMVSKGFHLKELLIKEQYSAPYSVLYIDEKEMRLYTGKLNQLNEIKNKELPMSFEEEGDDTFINSFLARNSYNKDFERSSNEVAKIRYQNILRKADDVLHMYLRNSIALVLCGTRKYLSGFMNTTKHGDKVISVLYGNYSRFTEVDFSEISWPIVKTYIEQEMVNEIEEYDLKMAEGSTEEGIGHIWDAIASDRGMVLLVEKNFSIKGFINEDDSSRLYLHAPQKPHSVLPDAVDQIIKIAVSKDLKIVFVEDGMLNRHMRIALITK